MRGKVAAAIAACILLFGKAAAAHRIDEYLQATILSLEVDRVQASMRLIPGILVSPSLIASIDSDGNGSFSENEERAYAQRVLADLSITIDGKSAQPKLVAWSLPRPAQMRDGLGEIHISYTVDLPFGGRNRSLIIANHHLSRTSVYLVNVLVPQDRAVRILSQKRNDQQSLYQLDYQQMAAVDTGLRRPWTGVLIWLKGVQFSSFFRLGMRHIAEGTDHLLFLLVLLLPAPMLLSGLRWGPPTGARQSLLRILGIVTAFTAGHSITLTVAAFNAVKVASRPVEVLIAVSILLSAVHALRPIFPGKEALIAGSFGLIHGLAFAATLNRLALGYWERVAGVFAFNLGIETMQIFVVVAILPSLLLMNGTRAYSTFRIGGAAFAALASLGRITERLFHVETPVDSIVNGLARHGLFLAATLLLLSLVCKIVLTSQANPTIRGKLACGIPGTRLQSEGSGIREV